MSLSDNEIIKALEDLLKNFDGKVIDFMAISSAIDLINRQKAEIEKLRKRVNFVEQANVQLREELKETTEKFNCQQYVYADLSKIIKDKNAEIERFKKIETAVNAFWSELQKITTFKKKSKPTLEELLEYMENLKAEVIKEFAERVKEKFSGVSLCNNGFVNSTLNNLVKEMTEPSLLDKKFGGDA